MESITKYHEAILAFALDFGKKLLESGHEITKTQDTMVRLCKKFNAEQIEFFVIPSQINATIKFSDGNYITQMREVLSSNIDLYKIEKLNSLSRKICNSNMTLEECQQEFNKVLGLRPYNYLINAIGAGLGTGGFSVFFGGTILDGICAFLIGFIAHYLLMCFSKYISKVANCFAVSFIDGMLALMCYKLGLCNNLDMVMIGVIMTMIPGMAFGNSVKDMLIGNIISGILTILNAFLIAVAIASAVNLSITIFYTDYIMPTQQSVLPLVRIISGVIGTLGFGLLFSIDTKRLITISLGGLFTTLILLISEELITQSSFLVFFSNVIASFFAGILCEILARTLKAPTAIFLLPCLIPLVPGGSLYRTMFYFLNASSLNSYTNFYYFLGATVQTGFGIAVGIVLSGIITQIVLGTIRIIKTSKLQAKK